MPERHDGYPQTDAARCTRRTRGVMDGKRMFAVVVIWRNVPRLLNRQIFRRDEGDFDYPGDASEHECVAKQRMNL